VTSFRLPTLLCLAVLLALATAVAPASADSPAPAWRITSATLPTNVAPGQRAILILEPLNVGAASSSGSVTVVDTLPPGVTATAAGVNGGNGLGILVNPKIEGGYWECTITAGSQENSVVTCQNNLTTLPAITGGAGFPTGYNPTSGKSLGRQPKIFILVQADAGAQEGAYANQMEISGGGGTPVSAADPLVLSSTPAPYGLAHWDGWFSNLDGSPDTQAGSVPYSASFNFDLNSLLDSQKFQLPSGGEARDFIVTLPPGLVGNPQAVPQCPRSLLVAFACPQDTKVGNVSVGTTSVGLNVPVYNMVAAPGFPAEFAFSLEGVNSFIDPSIRTGGDYGITTNVDNVGQKAVLSSILTLWGVPNDPTHNVWRVETDGGCTQEQLEHEGRFHQGLLTGCSLGPHPALKPFLRLPTSCGAPLPFSISTRGWLAQSATFTAPLTFLTRDDNGTPLGLDGCNRLPFEPTISSVPTTNVSDAPTGLDFHLHIPQPEAVVSVSQEGLTVNEIQEVAVEATAGDFKLGFGGESTADVPVGASAAALRTALESLPSIGVGNLSVTSNTGFGITTYFITFEAALGAKDVEQLTPVEGSLPLSGKGAVVSVATATQGTTSKTLYGEPALHEADLKDAVVTLPKGVSVNPASANGLGACSPAQIGLTSAPGATPVTMTPGPAECPNAAKIGAVSIQTPLLDHPVKGGVYVATPEQNPFGSLLAIYIAVNDEQTGTVIKLPGRVEADAVTGQLKTTFPDDPQLPFEDFHLEFFKGAGAALRTPSTCGKYETVTQMTPWSSPEGADAHPTDSFETTQSPGGGACPTSEAQLPNAPSFTAGTITPKAGAYTPFVLHLARADGTQEIGSIDTTLPNGLVGKLAGITECSDAQIAAAEARNHLGDGGLEQASPSCPLSSEVGTVHVGAGAGPAPYYVTGHAYLAGPYRGAPLSLEVITPAVAGPYDLGAVAVRTALYVNETTAQIHAVSDSFPRILQGIPLDVRSIDLNMDRSNFTLNPTNCGAMQILGSATSTLGNVASLSQRFQVGECNKLGFKPKLTLGFKGGHRRTKHPALKSVVTYPRGSYANIAKAAVTLPGSEIIDQNHIGNPCTRPVFLEGRCPKISVLGRAKAWSPLLDKPLEGKVYFRSNGGERALPDVVADLNGQIHVVLVGAVDTVTPKTNPRIRTTFFAVPDAPVSKFVLELKGGKEGLLVNSENVCKSPQVAVVKLTAQNGKTYDTTPTVANSCGNSGKSKGSGQKTSKRALGLLPLGSLGGW
jgi:hypothetical protein